MTFFLLCVQCWPNKLNNARYHNNMASISTRSMGQDSGPDHFWGMVGSKHWWTRSHDQILTIKKSATDVSSMSPGMLVIAFHFSPLNFNQTFFGPYLTHLACTLLNFAYLLKCVALSQNNAMTSCSLLIARLIDKSYDRLLLVPGNYYNLPTRLTVASFAGPD